MSGRQWSVAAAVLAFSFLASSVQAQERREREPNSVYAERRAKLASQVDAPIVLWGFTGREEISQDYIFAQEENFYYLTGHNEEGAGLIVLPAVQNDHGASSSSWSPAPKCWSRMMVRKSRSTCAPSIPLAPGRSVAPHSGA